LPRTLHAAFAFVAVFSAACRHASVDLPQNRQQNILVVTIDTLRSGSLGYERGPARTPNIDRLAAGGLRFTFAHAHSVVTLPSHASIITGLYPFQHGYRENAGYRLSPGTVTLASRLKDAGFATGAFLGAFPLDARFGLTAGFDVYDGRFDDAAAGAAFVIPERPGTVVVARARAWIAKQSGPWFAWVHLYEPHAPYRPPPPFDRDFASQPYYGEVSAADAALGPLFDALAQDTRPTTVFMTADHGESLNDHGEQTHGLFAYESTLHIPLLLAQEGRPGATAIPSDGLTIDDAVRHVDIVPTILDVLGLPVPDGLPGHSLRTAADRAGGAKRASYFEAMSGAVDYGWAPLVGVLTDRQKYINLPTPELYDLSRDPNERTNLAATDTEAESVRALSNRLAQFQATLPAEPGRESADTAARLRSLGYVSPSGDRRSAPPTEQDDPKRLVSLDAKMHQAAELDERGQLGQANEIYRQILGERSTMTGAARHLAFNQWRLGDAPGAIATLEHARSVAALSQIASTGLDVQLGAYLTDTGHTDRAIALLERTVAAEPTFDALNALGLAQARTGRPDRARATLERALAIDPRSAIVYENLGAVSLDANLFADARRAFEQAVALDPSAAPAHNGLAITAARTGDRATAITHWLRAIEIDPGNFDALYDLGVTLAKDGQSANARIRLEQFLQHAPADRYAREIDNANALLKSLKH